MEGKESLHFQAPPLTEIDVFHYGVKMYMGDSIGVSADVCTRACAYVCGLRLPLAAGGEEVIHLVTAISQSPCVCTFLCKCGTCVFSGEKTSRRESNGKMKKHDLWWGVGLRSSGYSNACKS